MKKLIPAVLLVAVIACGKTKQVEPLTLDYTQVENFMETGDYDGFVSRIEAGEELTNHDLALVYYGTSFRHPYLRELAPFFENGIMGMATEGRKEEALESTLDLLNENPVNLMALKMAIELLKDAGNKPEAKKFEKRRRHLHLMISSSGKGTAEEPYQVIYMGDMFDFISEYLGVEDVEEFEEGEGGTDVLDVVYKNGKTEKLFFAYDLCSTEAFDYTDDSDIVEIID